MTDREQFRALAENLKNNKWVVMLSTEMDKLIFEALDIAAGQTSPESAQQLTDFAELKLLIDEYDPTNSDWNFRKNVLLDVLVRLWPKASQLGKAQSSPVSGLSSRDQTYEIVLRELETKHPIPTTVLLATRIANALCDHAQSPDRPKVDPAELWERYLEEIRADRGSPSPQGAMAFAVDALTSPDTSTDRALLPRKLTAENGAKAALIGEFHEDFGILDENGDEQYVKVAVTWDTIKRIWEAAVRHFEGPESSPERER